MIIAVTAAVIGEAATTAIVTAVAVQGAAVGGYETGVAIYEAVTGEEAYTGRELSATEQGERYGKAAVGLFDIAASGRSALKGRFGGGGGNKCGKGGKGGTCFSAGTLVMTTDGLVAIEEIEVGDEVYAYDFETESVEVCVVEEVLSNYTYNWVEICTADGGEITSTRSHRFWSLLDQDWVTAVELHSGDLLYSADGTSIQVLSASVRALDEPETTYNLEVQRCHSYYVGASSILVHNGPAFIVTPDGTVFIVPKGAAGPTPVFNPAGKQTGVAFTGGQGGANGKVNTMRIMDPVPPRGASPGYPKGYVVYENGVGKGAQAVDPSTGKTLPRTDAHFPCD